MKKTFPIIILLITISLLGIILIQLSWIRNMILVKKEQFTNNVDNATRQVCEELSQYKGSMLYNPSNPFPGVKDEFGLDLLKPITIGQRFTVPEITEKIRNAFVSNNLKDAPFGFALATTDGMRAMGYIERQSVNYLKLSSDSVHNYSFPYAIIPPAGTYGENLTPDEFLVVIVPDISKIVFKKLRLNIWAAVLFTIIIFAAFFLTVNTMLRQKKLSEIKNDFINNMTHEFKTPLATISLAVDALKNEKVITNREKMGYFSGIIKEENQRMHRQVETILKAALMDRQEVQLHLQPLHAHEVIESVADYFKLQLDEKQGSYTLRFGATNDLINADEVHFSNLINNLFDNSVKYAKDNMPPKIDIATSSDSKNFYVTIADNGIGMSKETLKKIFEKFYRAHTGNVHNVKGFGLGLSYVKTMVEAHGGEVKAESVLGKGTTFKLSFPLKKG